MIKKTVTYEDYDGNQQTETLFFNISKSEAVEMNVSKWFQALIGKVTNEDGTMKTNANGEDTLQAFRKIIGLAYGTRTVDARRFHKDPEQSSDFLSSPAYDALFMDLMTGDNGNLRDFIMGMIPADLAAQVNTVGVKVNLPDTTPPPLQTTPSLPIISVVTPPAPVSPPPAAQDEASAIPNAFRRHGHGPQQRTAPPADTTPEITKPLDEMTDEELAAELKKRRDAKASATQMPAS